MKARKVMVMIEASSSLELKILRDRDTWTGDGFAPERVQVNVVKPRKPRKKVAPKAPKIPKKKAKKRTSKRR